jgi:hypothetical protein
MVGLGFEKLIKIKKLLNYSFIMNIFHTHHLYTKFNTKLFSQKVIETKERK